MSLTYSSLNLSVDILNMTSCFLLFISFSFPFRFLLFLHHFKKEATKKRSATTVSNTQSVELTCFESCSLRTHAGAQLNGLRQMHRLNVLAARKVRNRACHLQDAVMAAGTEIEHIKVALHNILRRRVQLAIFNNLTPAHLRITMDANCLQALLLQQSRLTTRSRMAAEDSPFPSFQLAELHLLRLICISILSIKGPEILRL